MNQMSPNVQRILIVAGLAVAFLVMASVFTPERSRAGNDESQSPSIMNHSADPHVGLKSLGSIEGNDFRIDIFATDAGPRYSVYENATGEFVAVLLTLDQVDRKFPELQLPTMDYEAGTTLMLADPNSSDLH